MKRVVDKKELIEKMDKAIDLLCDTVKTTLGPSGCNSIIDHSLFEPFITNDGVTIAQNIESEDEVVETILEIAKESAMKTNERVGDGTTTTLVYLQTIYKLGREAISNGKNPILLKKELTEALTLVLEKLTSLRKKPKEKELLEIACVSGNSQEIGNNVFKAYQKVKEKNSIQLVESEEEETKVEFLKGYILENALASSYFLQNGKEKIIREPTICILPENIEMLEQIDSSLFIEESPVLLFSNEYTTTFLNKLTAYTLDNSLAIYPLKINEYGENYINTIEDIKLISNSKNLGKILSARITNEKVILQFVETDTIKKQVLNLKKQREEDTFREEKRAKRIAMLTHGTCIISVGGKTPTERREKKMRYEDALCALYASKKGILIGGGLSSYQCSTLWKAKSCGEKILQKSLCMPLKQILWNAGCDEEKIIKEIETNHFNVVYNVKKDRLENVLQTSLKDSLEVVKYAIMHATSVASMLLTTTSLIINEHTNDSNRINNYTEL